ncbi:MAG: IS110 family transposase [Actinomycetota bacterium]
MDKLSERYGDLLRGSYGGSGGAQCLLLEPTGHRWKPLLDRSRARDVELACVQPLLVHRAREGEDFTKDRSDFKDARIIARLAGELRCYVPLGARGGLVPAAPPRCPP